MKIFQKRLKRLMDHGATYLEALHLLKVNEKKHPSKTHQSVDSQERQKKSS